MILFVFTNQRSRQYFHFQLGFFSIYSGLLFYTMIVLKKKITFWFEILLNDKPIQCQNDWLLGKSAGSSIFFIIHPLTKQCLLVIFPYRHLRSVIWIRNTAMLCLCYQLTSFFFCVTSSRVTTRYIPSIFYDIIVYKSSKTSFWFRLQYV